MGFHLSIHNIGKVLDPLGVTGVLEDVAHGNFASSKARPIDYLALGPFAKSKTARGVGRAAAIVFGGAAAAGALAGDAAAAGSSTGAGLETASVSAGAAPAAGADLATGGLIVTPEEAATSGAIFSTPSAAGSGLTLSGVLAAGKTTASVLGLAGTLEGLLAPRPTVTGAAQPYTGITIFPPDAGLFNRGGSPFGSAMDQAPANFTSSATMIGLGILVALLLAAFFKR